MNEFIQTIRQKKLFWRLFSYFILVCVIPLTLSTGITLYNSERNVMRFAYRSANSAMDIIAYNIEQQFQKYYHLAYFLTRDVQLQDISRLDSARDLNALHNSAEQYRRLIKGYADSVPGIDYIGIAYKNGIMLTSKTPAFLDNDQSQSHWFRLCEREPDQVHFVLFKANSGPLPSIPTPVDVILACRAIHDGQGRFIGVSMVIMANTILAQSATNILDRNGSFLSIVDSSGGLVYSPYVGMLPEVESPKHYIRIERHLSSMNWSLIGMMRVRETADSLNQMRLFSLTLLIAFVLLVIILSILLSKRILRPLYTLNKTMNLAEKGDLYAYFPPGRADEINDLGLSFNSMMVTIRNLMTQVRIEQDAKRKAEISLLLTNIKPHFLYNTLDSISWMAAQYKADDIVEAINALSVLYRISLSKGSDTISVADEISHVSSYLKIQKLRYEDKLNYEIVMDDSCANLFIQKLIIQPLVENAIYHGIKLIEEAGLIKVSVRVEGELLLVVVEDNGQGMPDDKLESLRNRIYSGIARQNDPGKGYGLTNVNSRLVLSYGNEYGLDISSRFGIGTTCVIRHPVIRGGECIN